MTGIRVTVLGAPSLPVARHLVVQDSAGSGGGGRGSVLVVLHRKASAEDTLRAYAHAWKMVSGCCRMDMVLTGGGSWPWRGGVSCMKGRYALPGLMMMIWRGLCAG